MHHRVAFLDVHHRARAQPRHQLLRVGRAQYVVEGVILAPALDAFVLRHQVQVVVSKDGDRPSAQVAHEPEHLQRFRAAIDKVADEPQAVALFVEAQLFD